MNKQQRRMTWMCMTINHGDGDMDLQISIQDFLDGNITCTTGLPWDEDDPQREMVFDDFLLYLKQEWTYKSRKDWEEENR